MQTVENGAEILASIAGALGVTDAKTNEMLRIRCELAEDYINNIFDDLSKARKQLAEGDKTMRNMAKEVTNLEKAADKIWQNIIKYKDKISE